MAKRKRKDSEVTKAIKSIGRAVTKQLVIELLKWLFSNIL